MPNPKTIKEIIKEFSINYVSEYRWRKDAINNLSAEDFIEKSLLSLLDEIENKTPLGIFFNDPKTGKNPYYSKDYQLGYIAYREYLVKFLSDLREK